MGTQGDQEKSGGVGAETSGAAGAGSAGEQVEAARAAYAARQEAESVLAEASRIRASAAADADAILLDAQVMADRLQSESLAEYERLVREATERADGILARARLEADRLRAEAHSAAEALRARAQSEVDQVRAQIREELREEQLATLGTVRLHSDGLLRDIESGVLGLGTAFERANASVADVVATIGELRNVTSTVLTVPPPVGGGVVHAADPAPAGAGDDSGTPGSGPQDGEPPVGGPMIGRAAGTTGSEAASSGSAPVESPWIDPHAPAEARTDHTTRPSSPSSDLSTAVPSGSSVQAPPSMVEEFMRASAAGDEAARAEVPTGTPDPVVPAADENATSFLGTDPPRPVTDWSTGPEVGVQVAQEAAAAAVAPLMSPAVPGVRSSADDQTRPLGWLFRASAS